MRRRALLALALALAAPAVARAQERARRVGFLAPGVAALESFRANVLPELARLGFVEGRNMELLVRVSDGFGAPLHAATAELLALRPEVISAASLPVVQAILARDTTIPVVMFGSTLLVGTGIARSFARPGGNVTGVALLPEELNRKRIEIAREAFPDHRRIGFLGGAAYTPEEIAELRAVAERLGATLLVRVSPRPGAETAVIEALRADGAQVLVVGASPVLASRVAVIAETATAQAMPTVCEWRYLAEAGCTLSYGPQLEPLRRRNAHQIARVLRGEHPSTIPVEIPDRFELVINQRAARALGIEFPNLFLARADEVIE